MSAAAARSPPETALPRRLSDTMQQRLDQLSDAASQVVQVAAVLPDQFSARLLAAMLERRPAALVSAVEEAVRADLLIEDGDQLRFRHDLLREATRQSLPQSLRRAMERQSATIMLDMGAAPEEVATQLARSADVGDQAAIAALRQAAQSVANSDPSAASDLSKRALELLPPHDPGHGPLVTETIVLLNRATRYEEAQRVGQRHPVCRAGARRRGRDSPPAPDGNHRTAHSDTSKRTAAHFSCPTSATSPRHDIGHGWRTTWRCTANSGQDSAAADEAAAAAASTGDLEASILSGIALACLDCANGYAGRALHRVEELQALTPAGDMTAHHLAAIHLRKPACGGRTVGRCRGAGRGPHRKIPEGTRRDGASHLGPRLAGWCSSAAGRLSAARAAIEWLPTPESNGVDRRRREAHVHSGGGGGAHRRPNVVARDGE